MISGCSKSIVLDQVSQYEDNILSYGILPGNNFFVDEIKPDQLQLEWDASAHGSFASTSFITNDTLVFVSDLGGRITSFSLNDGKEIGQLKYSGGIEQTAVIDKNRLFFIVNEEKEVYSTLIVYDLLKGNEIASQRLNGRFATELVKKNNSVFAVSSFGLLYSFSPFGAVNWKIDLDTEVYANSAADEDHLFIATYSGIIHKIKINGGVILNSFDLGTEFDSGISLDDQNIYIGDKKGSLIAIDKMNRIYILVI